MNESHCPETPKNAPTVPRRRFVILILCVLLVVAAAVTACVLLLSERKPTPLERTLSAVLRDEGMPADQVNTDAGRFVLTLGKDVLGKQPEQELTVSGNTVHSGDRTGVALRFGTAGRSVGGQVLCSDDTVYLASPELFGKTVYSIPFGDGERLRASCLNPENGGEYALPQDVFDALCRLSDMLEAAQADKKQEDSFAAILNRLGRVVRENLKTEKTTGTVDLLDGGCECETVTHTLDPDGMAAVIRALKQEVDEYRPIGRLNALSSSGNVVTETDESLSRTLGEILNSETQKLSCSFTYALRNGYLVYASLRFEMRGGANEDDFSELQAGVRFASDPAAQREAEVTLTYRLNARNILDLLLTFSNVRVGNTGGRAELQARLDVTQNDTVYTRYRIAGRAERNDSGVLTADSELKGGTFDGKTEQLQTLATVHLGGTQTWNSSERILSTEMTALTVTAVADGQENRLLDLTESRLLLEIGGRTEKVRLGKAADLLQATQEDLQRYDTDAREKLDAIMSRISEESGALMRTKRYSVMADIPLGENINADHFAWDRNTNRVYVLRGNQARRQTIECYDGRTGKQICSRTFRQTVLSVDADAGFVAYTLKTNAYQVHIADGKTLDDVAAVTPNLSGASGLLQLTNVIIDGDNLFFTATGNYTAVFAADWAKQQCKQVNTGLAAPLTAYDRVHHVYAVMNGSGSAANVQLFRAGSKTGKTVTVRNGPPTTGVYFNGTAFQACGTYFSDRGITVKQTKLVPNRPYDRRVSEYQILYADSEWYLLLNRNRDNTVTTAAYTRAGAPVALPGNLAFCYCLGSRDGILAAVAVNGETDEGTDASPSVLILRATDTWTLRRR